MLWVVPAAIAARRSAAVRPGNVVQPVPIAIAWWASLLPTAGSPCSWAKATTRLCQGRPSIVGLNASSASGRRRVSSSEEAPEHPALGAQRVRHQWMGGDREAALLVDLADRRAEAPHRLHALLEEQRDEVAAERRDLLADDHLRPVPEVTGHRPGGDRGVDPLVVRDRDDVEVGRALDEVEDRGDPVDAVRGEAVDVEIGPAEAIGHAAGSSDGDPGSSRRSGPGRRPGSPALGRGRRGRRRGLDREIGPDLEERARPLLRGVTDERLERGRERGQGGRDPLPPRALRGDGHERQATRDPAVGQPPDADRGDPGPGLHRQQGRPDRERRRRAEEAAPRSRRRRCPGRRRFPA